MTTSPNQYIPLARKYRPNNFSELRGQEVLVKVLSHTIKNNRLAQGYLLTGIRGVGKTTSARIIAKTVNCTDMITEAYNIRACEKCPNCTSFNLHSHPDIIEIDAASKTGVDDIRRIIEISEYKPLLGAYKVFIIDEVHMLSKGAFNALLKILEEPPTHVIFIFATTEVQKIPLTIISRCQRYDLRRFTLQEIFEFLKLIAEKESLKFEPEALKIIASKSDGSARDALSMLDQAMSLSRTEKETVISQEIINQMLGLANTVSVIEFFQSIVAKDVNLAVSLINKFYISSVNLEIFIELVADFIAYLSKIKMLPDYTDPIYESFNDKVKDILAKISFSQLSILWQIYSKAVHDIKISHNPLIEVEMLAIKSIYYQSLPLPEELANHRQNEQPNARYQIEDFLEYLHQNNEMEIYYTLLNQVEIIKFTNNTLEIGGTSINVKTKDHLSDLLFTWSKQKFNVILQRQSEIATLKDKLTDTVKSGKDWELLKKHFPNAEISDILHSK